MADKCFEMFKSLVGDVPPYILTAAAVVNGNVLMMNDDTAETYLKMAEYISDQVPLMDEARFTLYDYLDACVNSSTKSFDSWLLDSETALQSEESGALFMKELVKEAERKREVYSMPIPSAAFDVRTGETPF